MKKHLSFLVAILCVSLLSSCINDEVNPKEGKLTDYDREVVSYFKEVALGFEFGSASQITRKWVAPMNVFVGGAPTEELLAELENIKDEINSLATDGFSMSIVDDRSVSNFYIFLGNSADYVTEYPSQAAYVTNNWGLFSVFWNGSNQLISGHMYVDTQRANATEQRHLLREELTQSLGLARDSDLYSTSIFQSSWTTTTSYAAIDEDLIRLLYHPDMSVGLNATLVDPVLKEILLND